MNTTTATQLIQSNLSRYTNRLHFFFSKPKVKFIQHMLFGMLASGKVYLSEIGRSLGESIPLKKTTERLSRNLGQEGFADELMEANLFLQKRNLRRCNFLIYDGSDIEKVYAQKMPGLARVWNGSKKKTTNGYWWSNIIGISGDGRSIIPAYSELYSLDMESSSENQKILKGIKAVHKVCHRDVITVIDRGGDRRKLYEPLLDAGIYFITRLTKKRNILYRGKLQNVQRLAQKMDKPVTLTGVSKKNNRWVRNTYQGGACRVSLPYENDNRPYKGNSIWLISLHRQGGGYSFFLASLPDSIQTLQDALMKVFEGYGHRWKIEEVHRQIKQDYHLEEICVRRYEALKNFIALVFVMVGFLFTKLKPLGHNMTLLSRLNLLYRRKLKEISGFIYYKLAAIVRICLSGTRKNRKRTPRNAVNSLQLILNLDSY
ncbi:MAG: transposase [Candidatus Marinimicrobia bacterium]|nr:transposase [Candidatus Neomarinimicrobiota bacterium]